MLCHLLGNILEADLLQPIVKALKVARSFDVCSFVVTNKSYWYDLFCSCSVLCSSLVNCRSLLEVDGACT